MALGVGLGRAGKMSMVDGFYVQCPYISNAYEPASPEFPSLAENDAVASLQGAGVAGQHAVSLLVTRGEEADAKNPLAWPFWASAEDLTGFAPTVVSVNECDVLRDEGLAFYRKLKAVGVPGYARTVIGTLHGSETYLPQLSPYSTAASVADIASFARSL